VALAIGATTLLAATLLGASVGGPVARAGASTGVSERPQATPLGRMRVLTPDGLGALPARARRQLSTSGLVAAAKVPKWKIAKSPHAKHADAAGYLSAVSCASPTDCIAVGGTGDLDAGPPYVDGTLAEKWNGRKWTLQVTPDPAGALESELTAITCTSPTSCEAVGDSGDGSTTGSMLAEFWDGSTWAIQPTPPDPVGIPSVLLYGVSCISPASCLAVGATYSAYTGDADSVNLAEAWNGATWTTLTGPALPGPGDGPGLSAVSCTPTGCMVVGGYYPGGGDVTATTSYEWDGTTFTSEPDAPNGPGAQISTISAVSCITLTDCEGVGGYASGAGSPCPCQALAEVWDGSSWTIQATGAPPSGDGYLDGVSCLSATSCTASGGSQVSPGLAPNSVYAESFDGTRWTSESPPDPPASTGDTASLFDAIGCTSGGCVAVGFNVDAAGTTQTLLESQKA
jgi:hypothetical protein